MTHKTSYCISSYDSGGLEMASLRGAQEAGGGTAGRVGADDDDDVSCRASLGFL